MPFHRHHPRRHPGHGTGSPPTPPVTPPTPPVTTPPGSGGGPAAAPVAPTEAAYTFADEFAGAAGSAPSASNWVFETGPGAEVGGNDETEDYVSTNATLDGNGHLVIEVTSNGNGGYNSSRITTQGKFTQQYGHWEASIAIENAQGCWPAFWCLGTDGQWPACGEADIMESYGTGYSDGTIWNSEATENQNGVSATTVDTGFHVYRMDWSEGQMSFYRDNIEYCTATSSDLKPWPFDTNGGMYTILNIATNGTGTDGESPIASDMPVKMTVDYLHIWAD